MAVGNRLLLSFETIGQSLTTSMFLESGCMTELRWEERLEGFVYFLDVLIVFSDE